MEEMSATVDSKATLFSVACMLGAFIDQQEGVGALKEMDRDEYPAAREVTR